MGNKILKSILTVAIAVLLTSFLVVTGLLYQDFNTLQHTDLENDLLFAATATEKLGADYLETLPEDRYRLTWISAEGEVLFDNRVNLDTLGDHSDREEFQEAIKSGSGDSIRYSSTLTEKTIYEAVKLNDGSILRISISSTTAAAIILELLYPIAIIAALAIILSIWLAHRMTRLVVDPLNKLNLDEPLSNDTYEELTPLLQRISSQHQEIELQMQLLKRKQQEFDQITGNMKEALVLLDTDRRILSINPAAIHLFQTASACEGKRFYSEQYNPDMEQALQHAFDHGHAEFTASSNEFKYLFNISRIDSDDSVQGIVILAFDVTEQANAEQLRREFTSNVSHELKTPLQSIIGSAELIENGIVKPEDMSRFVGHIRKEASRLVKLIEDIIRISQLDEGHATSTEEITLKEIAEEVKEVLQYAASDKQVDICITGDDGKMMGIQGLLFELIYNLADNGIRYNREGGSVHISINEEQEAIRLSVTDTGIGISPEHHSKIFERFYRVDKSHSKKSGGTGLGLSIVKHAVKYHHGTIHIESELGKGTCITVLLKKEI